MIMEFSEFSIIMTDHLIKTFVMMRRPESQIISGLTAGGLFLK